MRRVRDQRDGPEPMTSDAAKSDFIAAARRAAQAAAAEAEATKGRPTKKEPARGGLSRFLPTSRKSAVIGLAAIIVFIGALQMGRTLLSGGPDTASSGLPAISEEATPDAAGAGDESYADTDDSGAGSATVTADTGQSQSAPLVAEMTEATSPANDDTTGPLDLADYVIPESAEAGTATRSELPLSGEEYADEPMINVPTEAGPAALREAAEAGNPLALFEIGNRYAEGRGVEADLEMAAAWYEMAAESAWRSRSTGSAASTRRASASSATSRRPKTWYRARPSRAMPAPCTISACCWPWAPAATDNESAARWFLEAAELGVTDSQFNMGILAAKGIGMRRISSKATNGSPRRRGRRRGRGRQADEVAEMLSAEQLEKAKAAPRCGARTPDAESNSVDIPDGWSESSRTTASIDMRQAVVDLQRS
jgi:localization factor PodJL